MDELAQAPGLSAALQVLAGGDSDRLRLVRGEGGQRTLERYVAVPSLADARALLPADAGAPALQAALAQHAVGAASLVARKAAQGLGFASRLGLARHLLRARLCVEAHAPGLVETPLHGFLAEQLGRTDFATGLRLAPGRPNGKPVVQAVAHDGTVLAYAKFGWDGLTQALLRHEGETLRDLAPRTRGTGLYVPEVLHAGGWQGIETLVLRPLDTRGRIPRRPSEVPIEASVRLAAICPRDERPLLSSPFWQDTRRRIAAVAGAVAPAMDAVLQRTRDTVEARWGGRTLLFGRNHGDWIPPNIRRRDDGTFSVWDWERSRPDAPLGVDAMQFLVFLEGRKRRPDWRGGLLAAARAGLARHGLRPDVAGLLVALSLLETLLWFAEAAAAGRDCQDGERFVTALEAALASV